MGIKQKVTDLIPEYQYENGKKSHCTFFNVCNMFNPSPQSYIDESKKKDMEIIKAKNDGCVSFKVKSTPSDVFDPKSVSTD